MNHVRATRRTLLGGLIGTAALAAALPRPLLAQEATPVAPGVVTPAAEQLTWLLDRLNVGPVPEDEIAARFAPAYLTAMPSLTEVPASEVAALLESLAGELGPVTMQGFVQPPEQTPGLAAGLLATADGATYAMLLTVEPEAPHRILDVLTSPLTTELLAAPPGAPANWDELDQQLATFGAEASVCVAELTGDGLHPIHTLNPDLPLAVGSSFKLYVLGNLARQVAAGAVAWEDPLAIQDAWRSLPSNPTGDVMAHEPAGTEHTLREYAEPMIAISGNTATDHLLFTLGRAAVEAELAAMGNEHAALNRPLLATREVFALDLVLTPDQVAAYVAAGEAERRDLLEETVRTAEVAPVHQIAWVQPRNLDTVGWYASTADLCRAMAALATMVTDPGLEPVGEILALNPGLPPALLDPAIWSYAGHKGGALPGGINRTWLLERADGRRFALSATLNNAEAPLDLLTPDLVLAGAFPLLAQVESAPTGMPLATPAA